MNEPGIEDYPLRTMDFYASCIELHQLNTVVAVTGGMKTFFLLNLANFATMVGLHVCFVNLQMHIREIQLRIFAMAHNQPLWDVMQGAGALKPSPQVLEQLNSIGYVNLQGSRLITAGQVASAVNLAIRELGKPVLILVDGLESMAEYNREKMDEVVAHLGNIAAEQEACIWMTAQGNRQSIGREIFDIPAIAETSAKAQISSMVLALGPRIDLQLLTASWPKVRNGPGESGSIVRLVVRPSLRLEVLEVVGDPVRLLPLPDVRPQPIFIGCEPNPAPKLEDAKPSTPESDIDYTGIESMHPPLRPFHGTTGWVGIGRAVSASPMFANRNTKHVYWLLDLYFMAQFTQGMLYAPKTNHQVKLARGQVMTSPRMLANRWGVSRSQVETFLAIAVREGLIKVETEYKTHRASQVTTNTHKPTTEPKERALCSIITLLHYAGYNDEEVE